MLEQSSLLRIGYQEQFLVRFDYGYTKSTKGVLKALEVFFNLVFLTSIICQQQVDNYSVVIIGLALPLIGIKMSGTFYNCYILHIVETFIEFPWHPIDFITSGLMAVSYLIVSKIVFSLGVQTHPDAGKVCAVGFINVILYTVDGLYILKNWRDGKIAQGDN